MVTRPTNDSPSPMVDHLFLLLSFFFSSSSYPSIHSVRSSFHLSYSLFILFLLSLHSFTECITRSHDILPCLSQFKFLLKIFSFEASCLTLFLLSSLSHFLSSLPLPIRAFLFPFLPERSKDQIQGKFRSKNEKEGSEKRTKRENLSHSILTSFLLVSPFHLFK